MKKKISIITILLIVVSTMPVFSAHVINKEDAALFKKDSIYSEIDVGVNNSGNASDKGSSWKGEDAIDKFSVVTATKEDKTFTNQWSNYKIRFEHQFLTAKDSYDFYADGMKFDFGIYFGDYSRIAVYYTRLSRDLNVIAANFSPGAPVSDVTIAGEVFKHVSLDVPYPYGIEKYEYYFRNIDGKLMVIELYYEDGREISKEYIDKFERLKD